MVRARVIDGVGGPAPRRVVGAVCTLGLAVWVLAAAGAAQPRASDPLVPVTLKIGFTRSSFTGVNEIDARAAFKVFAQTMGERRGYRVTPDVRVFSDLGMLRDEIERGGLQLAIMDSWDYLTIDPGPAMPVEFVTVEQGVVLEPYLLLVRAGSRFTDFADLAGAHMVVLSSTNANSGTHWLRTELRSLGFSEPQAFLGRYEIDSKVSRVILPVFFGTADACIVDRSGLEVMSDLNPQVERMVRTIRESEPLLDTVACVSLGGWEDPQQREDLLEGLQDIANDPSGRQIMSLFKFDRLIPFRPEHLESIRTLRNRHDALGARLGNGGGAAALGASGAPDHG